MASFLHHYNVSFRPDLLDVLLLELAQLQNRPGWPVKKIGKKKKKAD